VHFQASGRFVDCPIYERDRLRAGNRIQGPAVIEQADSTIVVPPSFNAVVDAHGRIGMTHPVSVKKKDDWTRA
jgi:N-methylhydantoinase A/oxoprolinase/acetone carboxylase beta subunit